MSRWIKVLVVVAGFLLAVAAACAAGWLYDLRVSALPYDTSGGMYAGGQLLTMVGVFLLVAMVPTVLAVWFLRRNETVWKAISLASLAFAVVGLVAVLMPLVTDTQSRNVAIALLSLLGFSQLLGVPLWIGMCAAFTLLAPPGRSRRRLVAALGCELAIAVCAAIHWLVPSARI